MGLNLHTQQYVEWKVYNVTSIKNKEKGCGAGSYRDYRSAIFKHLCCIR